MIHFVEDLPAEWRPKWEEMKRTSTNTLDGALGTYLYTPATRVPGVALIGDIGYTEDEKPEIPRLDQNFLDLVHEPMLQSLLPIVKGLLRFRPEDQTSAEEALEALFNAVVPKDSVESCDHIV